MTIKTPALLRTEITADFPDNATGAITPALLRTVTTDIVDTYAGGGSVFNVKQYGAAGDGSTDDTSAINSAIAALNTAGSGRLYFPAGTYKVVSSLTAITASCIIRGDGAATSTNTTGALAGSVSSINFTSNNTPCLTVNSLYGKIENISVIYTGVSTPVSPSAGIVVSNANLYQKVDYDAVAVYGFYINIDVQVGTLWSMVACLLVNAQKYNLKIQNTVNADGGDWSITNSWFIAGTALLASTMAASVRIESSGGGKIVNCKINGGGNSAIGSGIDLIGGAGTSDFSFIGNSVENFTGTGFNNQGLWPNVDVIGNEFACYNTAGGFGIVCTGNSNVTIIGNTFGGTAGFTTRLIHAPIAAFVTANITSTGSIWSSTGTPSQDGSGGVGGNQFLVYDVVFGNESRFTWTSPNPGADFIIQTSNGTTGGAQFRATNDAGKRAQVQMLGTTNGTASLAGKAFFASDTGTVVASDALVASGGSDAISFRAGGYDTAAEVFQALASGKLAMTNGANFSANGSVATTLGSVGPTGSHTTVQKWLTLTDGTNTLYIPCF